MWRQLSIRRQQMNTLHFPEPYEHRHPPVKDVTRLLQRPESFSQKAAEWIAMVVGSWRFLIIQSLLLVVWFFLNSVEGIPQWDPYPFIFMNLVLSLQAAYTASVVMISENRQNERDRLQARIDFEINQKAEEEVRAILDHLACQDQALRAIHAQIMELQTKIAGRQKQVIR
jgi:uncharacterized membrane protein